MKNIIVLVGTIVLGYFLVKNVILGGGFQTTAENLAGAADTKIEQLITDIK